MFTIGSLFLIAAVALYAERANVRDRANVAVLSDDEVRTAVLHARQDVKLVAYMLGGVIFMLGVIADRVH